MQGCGVLLTHLMGATSSLGLRTGPFEFGTLRLVLSLANLSRGILALCVPSLTPPMGNISYLALRTTPSVCGIHLLVFRLSRPAIITPPIPIFVQRRT